MGSTACNVVLFSLIDGLSRPSGTQRRSSRIGNRENNPPMEENPRTTHSESPSFWGLFNASMLMMMKEKRRKAAVQRVTYLKMHIIKIYEQVLNTDTTHQPLFDLPQRGSKCSTIKLNTCKTWNRTIPEVTELGTRTKPN